MPFPPTLFLIRDRFGILSGLRFTERDGAEGHVSRVDASLRGELEIGEYRLVTPKLEPDLAFCEGEERG